MIDDGDDDDDDDDVVVINNKMVSFINVDFYSQQIFLC